VNTASGKSAFFVISAGIKESFFAALLLLPCTGKSSSGFTGGGNGTNAFTDNRQAMPVHNGYTEAETCSTFGNCRTENGPCSKYFSICADDDDVFVFVLFSFAVVLDAVVVVVIIIATAARLVQKAFGFSLSRNTFSPVVSIVIGGGLVVARAKVVSSSFSSSSMVVLLLTSKNSSLEAALVVVVSRRRFPSMVSPPLEDKLKFPKVQDDIRLILLFLLLFLASRSAVVVILLRAVVVVALAAVINGVDVIVDVINIVRALLC